MLITNVLTVDLVSMKNKITIYNDSNKRFIFMIIFECKNTYILKIFYLLIFL